LCVFVRRFNCGALKLRINSENNNLEIQSLTYQEETINFNNESSSES
jgi:hypothetical protein